MESSHSLVVKLWQKGVGIQLLLWSHEVMSDSVAPWTVACQALLSIGFPRQEYWSGLPLPSPGDLPNPGTEPESPALAGRFFTTEPPGKPHHLPNDQHMLQVHAWVKDPFQ